MTYFNDALIGRDDATWGDEPRFHTPDREYVYPGRKVLVLTGHEWPHTPEECPGQSDFGTEWFFDGTVLVCKGCGLDST